MFSEENLQKTLEAAWEDKLEDLRKQDEYWKVQFRSNITF